MELNENLEVEIINSDREKIYVIMNNILDNAFKFSEMNSLIEMKVFLRDEFLYIQVLNNGNELNKEKMLESFYEGEMNNTAREKRGLGLGNNLISVYVEFLGGKLDIKRENNRNLIEVKLPVYSNTSEDIFGCDLDEFDFGDDDGEFV